MDDVEGLQLLHFPAPISEAVLPAYVDTESFTHCCIGQPAAHSAKPGWKETKQLPKITAPSLSTSTQGRGRS